MPRVLSCSQEGSEKEIDLGWSLVSGLLGDRCKMTIDDSVLPEFQHRKCYLGN